MKSVTGNTIAEFLEKFVDKSKQIRENSVELTIKSITQLEGIGKIDFVGNEFQWAQRTVLSPRRINPGDESGWWTLTAGDYIVRLNEVIQLPPNHLAIILPQDRIIQNGAYHAPVIIQTAVPYVEVLLQVGRAGLEVKENARFSQVIVFQL
jgi:deoxycytidine triphosphate deaminase